MGPVTSPTNHTSSAMFGMLEVDPTSSSLDEQSSIEESTLMGVGNGRGNGIGNGNGNGGDSTFTNMTRQRSPTLELESESILEESPAPAPAIVVESSKHPVHPVPSKPVIPNPASKDRTRHTSNVDENLINNPVSPYKRLEDHNNYENKDFKNDYDSDKMMAWAIHFALILFCALILVAVLLAFIVVSQYGLVAMCGVSLILMFAIFLAWFVDNTILSQNAKLRPIRRQILKPFVLARQALDDEFQLFQREWNAFYLLTNGEKGEATTSSNYQDSNEDAHDVEGQLPATQSKKRKKKKRSAVFKMIKPFLGVPRKLFRRKRKGKQPLVPDENEDAECFYKPPTGGVAA